MYYLFPRSTSRRQTLQEKRNRPTYYKDEEGLTHFVRGLKASSEEERAARSFDRIKKSFRFQEDMPVAESPDWKSVDFIVEDTYPVEVYGEIGHNSQAEQEDDLDRENQLNTTFALLGMAPMQILWWHELDTQEAANAAVDRLFL